MIQCRLARTLSMKHRARFSGVSTKSGRLPIANGRISAAIMNNSSCFTQRNAKNAYCYATGWLVQSGFLISRVGAFYTNFSLMHPVVFFPSNVIACPSFCSFSYCVHVLYCTVSGRLPIAKGRISAATMNSSCLTQIAQHNTKGRISVAIMSNSSGFS